MYYAYIVKTADDDTYKGLVAGDSFVSAMCKVDDYYDSTCATSVLLTCVTEEECYDIDDVNDRLYDDDEKEDNYDEIHSDHCDGNIKFEPAEFNFEVDDEKLKKLAAMLADI